MAQPDDEKFKYKKKGKKKKSGWWHNQGDTAKAGKYMSP
jgi:hypothetical protein